MRSILNTLKGLFCPPITQSTIDIGKAIRAKSIYYKWQ